MKTMNNFGKRSLAMFLVLVMCLGMMNLTVFAAEEHTHNQDGWICTQADSTQKLICNPHVHDENCYSTARGELTCQLAEHTHGEGCYEVGEETRICGLEESEGHTHSDEDCYEWKTESVLSCGQEEVTGHSHGSSCYKEETTVTGEDEDGNPITETTKELVCGESESVGHTHNDDCYTEQRTQGNLTCELKASEAHTHSDDCKSVEQKLVCEQNEHTHGDGCYAESVKTLICEEPDHAHTDVCYETVEGEWTCTPPESTEEPEPATCTCEVKCNGEGCEVCAQNPSACTGEEVKEEEPQPPAVCICDVKCVGDCTNGCEVCLNNPGDCEGAEPEEELVVSFNDATATLTISNTEALTKEVVAGYLSSIGIKNTDVRELVLSNTGDIDRYAFQGFNAMTNLTINGAGAIGDYAFYTWNNLKVVTIDGAASVGDHTFFKCASLETVDLKNIGTLSSNAFSESKALASVSLDTIGVVGPEVFRQCSALTTLDMKNVGTFERSPFSYCTGLTSVTLDGNNGINNLGTTMFYYCTGLTEVTLKNMDSVGYQAFNGCTALENVTLENVDTIETQAFYSCTALKTVEMDGIGTISANAFQKCGSLETVAMNNVDTIGEIAFLSCAGLKEVVMDNVSTIGTNAFASCTALETVTLNNVDTIGKYAFYNCAALSAANLGTVGTIGQYAFQQCANLKTVNMTQIDTIDQYAFWNCSALETIDSLENVTNRIGGFAFYGCSSLKDLSVNALTKMGYNGSVEMMDRIQAILAGTFQLDNAESIIELSQESGWDVGAVGRSNNWNQYNNGTQLMEQARWQNVSAGVAQVKVNAYYTAEQQMDYIFVADLSASMAQLGNPGDSNARFYDMQSKLLDMTGKLLDTNGYDCRVAIVTFGGEFKGNATQKSSGFLTDAGDAADYIKKLEPLNENTDYGLGMQEALKLVQNNSGRNTTVVFLSDGYPTVSNSGDPYGTKTAPKIKAAGASIYGVLHSPVASTRDTALSAMEGVCGQGNVYESTDTESFGKAMNEAFAAAYGEQTVTIPVNAEDFDVSGLTASAGEISYSDGVITWTLNGMPFTPHSLTYTMSLKSDRVNVIGTRSYALNNGNAMFGENGASVGLAMSLSRTVNAPVVLRDLTINYLFEDGTQAAEPVTIQVAEGAAYSVASPVVEGYVASPLSVEGIMGTGNMMVNVTYLPVEVAHTLTINYVFANGEQAAESVTFQVAEGAAYSVSSPVLAGYTADLLSVEGTMGTDDVAVTVTYTSNGGTTGGGTTGGGTTGGGTTGGGTTGGGDTGTDNPPAPPTEEVTDPNVPLVETPEEEIPNEDVPLVETPNVPVEETVPGGKEFEEILDEKVPLVDAPRTGDSSALWYAMTLLSACGLAALNLLKKREK